MAPCNPAGKSRQIVWSDRWIQGLKVPIRRCLTFNKLLYFFQLQFPLCRTGSVSPLPRVCSQI